MSRPPRLDGFEYIGLHRYFLTFCARSRQTVFADPITAPETVSQFLRNASDEHFLVLALDARSRPPPRRRRDCARGRPTLRENVEATLRRSTRASLRRKALAGGLSRSHPSKGRGRKRDCAVYPGKSGQGGVGSSSDRISVSRIGGLDARRVVRCVPMSRSPGPKGPGLHSFSLRRVRKDPAYRFCRAVLLDPPNHAAINRPPSRRRMRSHADASRGLWVAMIEVSPYR